MCMLIEQLAPAYGKHLLNQAQNPITMLSHQSILEGLNLYREMMRYVEGTFPPMRLTEKCSYVITKF